MKLTAESKIVRMQSAQALTKAIAGDREKLKEVPKQEG